MFAKLQKTVDRAVSFCSLKKDETTEVIVIGSGADSTVVLSPDADKWTVSNLSTNPILVVSSGYKKSVQLPNTTIVYEEEKP